ncbi:MAG: hypothetical protein IJW97_07460 [Clostridia bacterium]|nr:hypothetical protein [Clostridia bacterium]
MALFKANTRGPVSPRLAAENTYTTARANLLLVVAITTLNIILCLCGADSYFLFSANIPYFLVYMGMLLCGKFDFSEQVFLEMGFDPAEGYFPTAILIGLTVIAFLIVAAFVLCYIFSSKHRVGWLIAALVFFGLDTLGMLGLYGISLDSILDILFHAWVLYYLIAGISAHFKLKNMPVEEEPVVVAAVDTEAAATGTVWDALNNEAAASREQPTEATEDETKSEE